MYVRRQKASLQFVQETAEAAFSQHANAVGTLAESDELVTLWQFGATPQLNTGLLQEVWANSRCQGNSPNFV